MTYKTNDLIRTAYENRLMRTREEVEAFEQALGTYADEIQAEDLPALYELFDNDTEHHEVMFGLLHLIETLPASEWLPAYLHALPDLMPRAAEWADTILARSLNGAETNPMLAHLGRSLPHDSSSALKRLLTDLARLKPKAVGTRAETMLSNLSDSLA